jgi:hypothetical protein
MNKSSVSVLFARADSHYKALPGVDVWDAERDARRWPGGAPVVAHPPCRAWGLLRQFAKPREDEKALAPWAVEQVRRFGGVLEHPARSSLWNELGLPKPGEFEDEFGGYTLEIDQFHWGHKAEKRTWLYVVGAKSVPAMPRREGRPTHVVRPCKNGTGAKIITKPEREHTPPGLAAWLVALAASCTAPARG